MDRNNTPAVYTTYGRYLTVSLTMRKLEGSNTPFPHKCRGAVNRYAHQTYL